MATSNDRDSKRGAPVPADLDDPSIPVLTERLTLPPLDIDFTLPPALTQPPPPPPVAPPALRAPAPTPTPAAAPPPAIHGLDTLPPQPLAPLPTTLSPPSPAPAPAMAALRVEAEPAAAPRTEPDWVRLEMDLRDSILRELSMRLPQNVEQIVREKMQPGIQAALDRLASETRLAIAASLRDLVDKAVRAEIAAMKARGGK
jgi:hypothetical protein